MGEYWRPVSVTKNETISPHRFGNGLKWGEWNHPGSATREALDMLLASRWRDDVVVIASDYGGLARVQGEPEGIDPEGLYRNARDISEEVGGVSPATHRLKRAARKFAETPQPTADDVRDLLHVLWDWMCEGLIDIAVARESEGDE